MKSNTINYELTPIITMYYDIESDETFSNWLTNIQNTSDDLGICQMPFSMQNGILFTVTRFTSDAWEGSCADFLPKHIYDIVLQTLIDLSKNQPNISTLLNQSAFVQIINNSPLP